MTFSSEQRVYLFEEAATRAQAACKDEPFVSKSILIQEQGLDDAIMEAICVTKDLELRNSDDKTTVLLCEKEAGFSNPIPLTVHPSLLKEGWPESAFEGMFGGKEAPLKYFNIPIIPSAVFDNLEPHFLTYVEPLPSVLKVEIETRHAAARHLADKRAAAVEAKKKERKEAAAASAANSAALGSKRAGKQPSAGGESSATSRNTSHCAGKEPRGHGKGKKRKAATIPIRTDEECKVSLQIQLP